MSKPIRVLHITEMLQAGGIESFIMNVYRNIDRSKVQFDFLLTRDEEEFYDEEVKTLGGRKITINVDKKKNVFVRVFLESKQLYKILKNSDYNIVHVHSGTPLRVLYLVAAKLANVKTRIYHSHSAEVKGPHSMLKIKKQIFKCLKTLFKFVGTDFFACSEAAAEWMYPQNLLKNNQVKVIYNGIELDKFKFNPEVRSQYRKELGIEDNFVIGHIGRFTNQKNHDFLIDIFNELYKMDKTARLLLIGAGELEDDIHKKVERLGLSDKVLFLGVRSDVNKIMQSMDVFLLPSNYEGLPVVGVEAQAAGLQCVFSDNVTKEVAITQNTQFMSLSEPNNEWAKYISSLKNTESKKNTSDSITRNGYNIEKTVKELESLYIK